MKIRRPFLSMFLSLIGSVCAAEGVQASGTECAYAIGQLSESDLSASYLPTPAFSADATLIAQIRLDGAGQGHTIQSIGLDPISCSWLAAAQLEKQPTKIGIWRMEVEAPDVPVAHVMSEEFAHPQDLSVQTSDHDVAWVWLPDEEGLGAKRFRLETDNGALQVVDVEHFPLLAEPLSSHTITVSADGQFLLLMGKMNIDGKALQSVRLYRVDDLMSSAVAGAPAPVPIKTWPLADLQQPGRQYRQGIAMIGQTVFVLSGSPAIGPKKWLCTYSLDGKLLASNEMDVGWLQAMQDGARKSYEPEGLEIIRENGSIALTVGIASGEIGARNFRLWSIPLAAQELTR